MIRLSPEAEADLLSVVGTISGNSGTAVARRVYGRIKKVLLPLDCVPLMARAGRVAGTRELPVPGLPYIVVYEPDPDGVLVLSIIHGARLWPPTGAQVIRAGMCFAGDDGRDMDHMLQQHYRSSRYCFRPVPGLYQRPSALTPAVSHRHREPLAARRSRGLPGLRLRPWVAAPLRSSQ